ncbi:MAG: P-II family nitrogen regulator [Selenomonadaceae bacterium]|nr:P-II family nitrogen regulator [Selenomonadaceae bacterium]
MSNAGKMYRVDIITRREKLDDLKEALIGIGVTGMTVSDVYGCGLTSGHTEIYRGNSVEVSLVPKIKVETVIYETPLEKLIETAEKACCTGRIGDGKIFVYEVARAVKIRTGERDGEAIVDYHE